MVLRWCCDIAQDGVCSTRRSVSCRSSVEVSLRCAAVHYTAVVRGLGRSAWCSRMSLLVAGSVDVRVVMGLVLRLKSSLMEVGVGDGEACLVERLWVEYLCCESVCSSEKKTYTSPSPLCFEL